MPTRYDLRLEPDLATCTFVGEETVTLTVHEPTEEILLNAAELQVLEAVVTGERGMSQAAAVQLDAATERCWRPARTSMVFHANSRYAFRRANCTGHGRRRRPNCRHH